MGLPNCPSPTPSLLPDSGLHLLPLPGPGSVQQLQKGQRSGGRGQPGVCGRAAADGEHHLPQRAVAAAHLDHHLLSLPLAGVLGQRELGFELNPPPPFLSSFLILSPPAPCGLT